VKTVSQTYSSAVQGTEYPGLILCEISCGTRRNFIVILLRVNQAERLVSQMNMHQPVAQIHPICDPHVPRECVAMVTFHPGRACLDIFSREDCLLLHGFDSPESKIMTNNNAVEISEDRSRVAGPNMTPTSNTPNAQTQTAFLSGDHSTMVAMCLYVS
jgi:hypothetical protein